MKFPGLYRLGTTYEVEFDDKVLTIGCVTKTPAEWRAYKPAAIERDLGAAARAWGDAHLLFVVKMAEAYQRGVRGGLALVQAAEA